MTKTRPQPIPPPSRVTVRVEAGGIRAINSRGGEVHLTTPSRADGFNPLELLSAALGICTAMTLRTELRQLGEGGVVGEFSLEVRGIKADDEPSRLQRLELVIALPPALDVQVQQGVVHRADLACTIANTLRSLPAIQTRIASASDA